MMLGKTLDERLKKKEKPVGNTLEAGNNTNELNN